MTDTTTTPTEQPTTAEPVDEGCLVQAQTVKPGDEIRKRGVWHRVTQVHRRPNGTIYLATESPAVFQTAVGVRLRARTAPTEPVTVSR